MIETLQSGAKMQVTRYAKWLAVAEARTEKAVVIEYNLSIH